MNEQLLRIAVMTQIWASDAAHQARRRLSREEGQTAAEYLGIILVISLIIAALVASDIGDTIAEQITNLVKKIGGGGGDGGGGGN